ncbi:MAG: DUF368 domain-containing protein [Clostridiales bacterium]|nr:DUF368 domain-containing protein [Clostridiales bacterium]
MALADSVPGVSGGTVAFILGYYEKFINSLNALVSKDLDKKEALKFLGKLGVGWAIGLILASLVLSSVFETHIYAISSLFIGFILFAIPSIIKEEKDTLKGKYQYLIFTAIGIAVVALLTYFNPTSGGGINVDINSLNIGICIYAFVVGMVAISAMILPGISGSTILLIFGLYIPIINSIKEVLHLQLEYLPILIVFGFGVLAGIALIIKLVKKALDKYRTQTIYTVIGLMIGSLYAIVMGPTTLKVPQEAMNFGTFNILFFVIGAAVIGAMEFAKYKLANKKTDVETTEEK